jgi:hypothetical protein
VVVPPAPSSPLRVLLLKNGGELVARLPIVPGLEPVYKAEIPDDDARLEAEGLISGYQEELVDVLTRREILVTRIRARLDKGKIDEARQLFEDELLRLPKGETLSRPLDGLKDKVLVGVTDKNARKKIESLFDDTQELIRKHLNDKPIEALREELRKASGGSVAPKGEADAPGADR